MLALFAGGVGLLGVVSYAVSRLSAAARPERRSVFVSFYVVAVAFGSMVGLVTAYVMADPANAHDLGALAVVWGGMWTSAASLAVGLLGLAACLAGNPGHVTRFRLFVLSFGIGTPALFLAMLFWNLHHVR